MVKTSVLNDALNAINNAEKSGKRQVLIRPSSKVIIKFLSVVGDYDSLFTKKFLLIIFVLQMQKHGMRQLYLFIFLSHTFIFGLITRQWFRSLHRPLPFKCPIDQQAEDLHVFGFFHDV